MDALQHETGDDKRLAKGQPTGTGQPLRRADRTARSKFKSTEKSKNAQNVEMLSADLSRTGRFLLSCYIGIMAAALVSAYLITSLLTPNWRLNRYMYGVDGRQTNCVSAIPEGETPWAFYTRLEAPKDTVAVMKNSRHVYLEGAVVGYQRTSALQASFLVSVAFICVLLAAWVPAGVVIFRPELVPSEFENCGTLSNLGHDISRPRGRVFTTMLFTASLLSLVSGYTHFYQNWSPRAQRKVNVLFFSLQGRMEKAARSAWVTLPNVGLMLTAALPSLTDIKGTNAILTIIHNIAAPSSLLIAWFMEAIQLGYGENAFAYFFCSDENASWFGYLDGAQRIRVFILGYFGIAGTMFLSMQFYLALPFFGVKVKTSYTFALVCFFAETTALILAYGLPLIQALSLFIKSTQAEHVFERAAIIETFTPPGKSMSSSSASLKFMQSENILLETNMSHRFLHPHHRASLSKQLYAGPDGQPLF